MPILNVILRLSFALITFPVTSLPPGIIPGVAFHISRRLSSATSPPSDSALCCPSIPLIPEKWTACAGISGRHTPDSVDGLVRNQWSPSTGLRIDGELFIPEHWVDEAHRAQR